MTSNTSRSTLMQRQKLPVKAPSSSWHDGRAMVDVLQKTVQNFQAFLAALSARPVAALECTISLFEEREMMLLTFSTAQSFSTKPARTSFFPNNGFDGWTIAHGEPLLLHDVQNDPLAQRLGGAGLSSGSLIAIPFFYQETCLGVLMGRSSERSAFTTQMLQPLTIFTEQVAITVLAQQQMERSRQFANQLEMAIEASRRMTTHQAPDALYRTVLLNVQRLIPYTHGFVHLYQSETQMLEVVAEWSGQHTSGRDQDQDETVHLRAVKSDHSPSHLSTVPLSEPQSITASAAVYRHSIVREAQPSTTHGDTLACLLATPFISKGRLFGVLTLERAERFSPEELRLVQNLCRMAATALENVELFHQVRLDQEQLRAVIFASTDGVGLVSADGRFSAANPAFGTIFGLKPSQIVGRECSDLFGCKREDGLKQCSQQCMILQALQTAQPLPYVELEFPVHGTSRLIGVSVTPVAMASGALCLLMVRDVTATRNATSVRANFISMITHELRSPLNSINGYLELALSGAGGELNPRQYEFVQRARASSEHLYTLLEDLLLISRADSGQMRMNCDVISLPDIVENAVEELELTALDRGVAMVTEVSPDFPSIYADPVRIQQVLRNLISNALRFTSSGGQITVSTIIDTVAGEDVVRLAVRDTGTGIPSEYHERIFERFFQSPDQGSSRSRSGQGLGLAIVKMIVELHGGTVTVESAVGKGSTFICTLPCLLNLP